MHGLKIIRAYEKPLKSDGYRILVDRLWPRGVKKEAAKIDLWLKDVAPSTALRQWFNHEEEKWAEFQRRYAKELEKKHELLNVILAETRKHPVSLIYGAKSEEHNHAIVLCMQLQLYALKQIH
jgi:uncharacterized protein YeaO (DUF488 family)